MDSTPAAAQHHMKCSAVLILACPECMRILAVIAIQMLLSLASEIPAAAHLATAEASGESGVCMAAPSITITRATHLYWLPSVDQPILA